MNNNLSETRIQQLKDAKKNIDGLSEIIGKILDGRLSMSEAGYQLGCEFPGSGMQRLVEKQFMQKLHGLKGLSKESFVEIMYALMTPYERLFHAIFKRITEDDEFVALDKGMEAIMDRLMEEQLTENRREAVRLYFGLDGEPHSFAEIGRQKNICKEQANALVKMSLNKLRCLSLWECAHPLYKECLRTEQEAMAISRMNERMEERRERAENLCRRLREENRQEEELDKFLDTPEIKRFMEFMEQKDKEKQDAVLNMPIDVLGLSPRINETLIEKGCHTVGDITALTKEQFLGMKHIGDVFVNNLENALAKLGLSFKKAD